jgi:membrane protein required for colicin V production
MTLSVIDIVLLLVGLFFIVRGLMRGFSGEIISLVGTAGGFACAIRFYDPFAAILTQKFGMSVLLSTILSMLAIFFLIFFGCALLETCIKKIISKTSLTATDKFLGAFVGLAKMYIIALLVFIGGVITSPMLGDEWMKESRVLSVSSATWPLISPLLDKAGILPDITAIQNEAKEYILRQAGQTFSDASLDMLPGIDMLPSLDAIPPGFGVNAASDDETEAGYDVTP